MPLCGKRCSYVKKNYVERTSVGDSNFQFYSAPFANIIAPLTVIAFVQCGGCVLVGAGAVFLARRAPPVPTGGRDVARAAYAVERWLC